MASTFGDLYRITVTTSIPNGSVVQNVFQYRHEGLAPVTDNGLKTAVGGHMGALWSYVQGSMDTNTVLERADILRINAIGETLADLGSVIINTAGLFDGNQNAPAVSMLLTGNTDVPGVRARKYLGGYVRDAIAEGLFSASPTAQAVTFVQNWLAGFTAELVLFLPGVVSKKTGGWVPLNATGSATNEPAYQRRRKASVGV